MLGQNGKNKHGRLEIFQVLTAEYGYETSETFRRIFSQKMADVSEALRLQPEGYLSEGGGN